MGAAISAVRGELSKADEEAARKAKQDLEILQKMLDTQLDTFENQINEYVTRSCPLMASSSLCIR